MNADKVRSRWATLAVLCLSVLVIIIDNTIVNVALPTLSVKLGATTSQLQWIVDAYTLVFAGLLLAAGSVGDRFGRKGVLQAGMAFFALFSFLASRAGSPEQLIAARAAMGVGAALIFPATLALLVNTFTDAKERALAIGLWSATTGLAVAIGPVVGGWLIERFSWGSVFLVNVPLSLFALVAIGLVVTTSRDEEAPPLDLAGIGLSIVGISSIVWAIIEGPHRGWTSSPVVAAFVAGFTVLALFLKVESTVRHPMLDVSVFRIARFSAGTLSVTFSSLALFGFIFLVTQYFQFVRGYAPFSAGLHTIPVALFIAIASAISPKVAARFGSTVVVAGGLASMSVGFVMAATTAADSNYGRVVLTMLFMGSGLGMVFAPATEAIMGSLPPEKAGVGSAVNDTTRELGGTLGVAIVGSLFSSIYSRHLASALSGTPLPASAVRLAKESVGAATVVAQRAGAQGGPALGAQVHHAVTTSFMDGFHLGAWASAAIAATGAVVAWRYLPAEVLAEPTPSFELSLVGD